NAGNGWVLAKPCVPYAKQTVTSSREVGSFTDGLESSDISARPTTESTFSVMAGRSRLPAKICFIGWMANSLSRNIQLTIPGNADELSEKFISTIVASLTRKIALIGTIPRGKKWSV